MRTMLKTLYLPCAVCLFLVAAMNGQAQGDEAAGALDILLRAEAVHDAAVGFAGQRTEVYSAFAELWDRKEGLRANAERLIADGTPAGKVYGLLLLRKADPAAASRAAEEVARSADSAEPVEVMQGCIGMRYELSEVATRIAKAKRIIELPSRRRR